MCKSSQQNGGSKGASLALRRAARFGEKLEWLYIEATVLPQTYDHEPPIVGDIKEVPYSVSASASSFPSISQLFSPFDPLAQSQEDLIRRAISSASTTLLKCN